METIFAILGILVLSSLVIGLGLTCVTLYRKLTNNKLARPQNGQEAKQSGTQNSSKNNIAPWSKNTEGSLGLVVRLVIISGLVLVMLLPIHMIQKLVTERLSYRAEVLSGLVAEWGQPQTLIGPILAVPFTITKQLEEKVPVTIIDSTSLNADDKSKDKTANGSNQNTVFNTVYRKVTEVKIAALTPKNLEIDGVISAESRQRGIYSALVYSNDLKVKGSFKLPSYEEFVGALPYGRQITEVHWNRAKVVVGLSNVKAFRSVSALDLGGNLHEFTSGSGEASGLPRGFSAVADLSNRTGELEFSFAMDIAGTGWFKMAPVGDQNVLKLKSNWPHPSFGGSGLPITRTVNDAGFTAEWRVPALVRTYQSITEVAEQPAPSSRTYGEYDGYGDYDSYDDYNYESNYNATNPTIYDEYLVGVNIISPVNQYTLSTRSIKFAIMFIALTFLIFLLLEINFSKTQKRRLHYIQYGVIGLSLALFYLILLSFSEHFGFGWAYLVATVLDIAMIGLYCLATTDRRNCIAITISLAGLYSVLYVILNLEDYALLTGTIILILAMVAVMASTRKLNTSNSVGISTAQQENCS
ncbi:MAG: cell envelope integrity protein CreD [Deltaproteobacteria bacterium]|jgi:inner membrane protein|nr:cell envelope integrity protein CreD [Deltaproteobacteria bacterium]